MVLLSFEECMWLLALDSIIYLVLYYYLEKVFPNEYGVKLNPCFCLSYLKNGFIDFFNKLSLRYQGFRNLENNNIEM